MKRAINLFVVFIIAFNSLVFAQSDNSIQLNGGMVSPLNSQSGVLSFIQYNHRIGNKLSIYAYSGIFWWDRNKVNYLSSQATYAYWKTTYSEESHRIIPVYAGVKYFFHNSSGFNPYFLAELGTGFFTYSSFDLHAIVSMDPEGNRTIYHDNKTGHNEVIFGAGLGLGLLHDISSSLQISFEIKMNTIKSSHSNWFSSGGTMRSFQVGLGYKL